MPTVRLPAPVFVRSPEVVRAPSVRLFAPVLIAPPLAPTERALADIDKAEEEVLTRLAPMPLRLIGPVPRRPAPSTCTVPPVMVTPPVKSLAEVSTKVPAPDFAILVPPVILSAAVGPLKVYVPDAAETLTEVGASAPDKVIMPPAALSKVTSLAAANAVGDPPAVKLAVAESQVPSTTKPQVRLSTPTGTLMEKLSIPAVALLPASLRSFQAM